MDQRHLIIFDGECVFCNRAVNFIIQRDPDALFVFAPRQSEFARKKIAQFGLSSAGIESLLLIKNDQYFMYTTAALEIARDLTGGWPFFYHCRVIPRRIRDAVYKQMARNRHRIFRREKGCPVPTDEMRSRFIDL